MAKRRRSEYRRYAKCKDCGLQGTYSRPLSANQLCNLCGEKRLRRNIRSQRAHLGPDFDKWRKGMCEALIAAYGGDVVLIFARDVPEEGCTNIGTKRNLA